MEAEFTPWEKRVIKRGVTCLLVVVVLGVLGFGGIRTIGAGEVGIITRFGEVNRIAESGLTFKVPFIEGITKMETRVQKAVAQQEVERAKQELEKVKIDAESKIEAAKAEAETQRLQQETLSEVMIKKMWIEKWDGKLPTTATGDSGLMINLGE